MPLDRDALLTEYHAELTREWREMPAAEREAIPEHLRGGLDRYILERIRPGHFLIDVLENDLAQAVHRANPQQETLLALPRLITLLYSYAPARCFGSPEKVEKWLAEGGEP